MKQTRKNKKHAKHKKDLNLKKYSVTYTNPYMHSLLTPTERKRLQQMFRIFK